MRDGTLTCTACGADFPVHRGVAELMLDPPDHITREADGLGRFAEVMRADGWDREMILRLPDLDNGYWYVQARSMHQILTTVPFAPGQWVLDVGSNTCWASNHFAERGLNAIALDISTPELQGLYTSDYFLEAGRSYFERVLGSMYDMPIASASLDYVFACEVLHHNDAASLRTTFQEAFRVLKPGGKLLVVNETIKTLRTARASMSRGSSSSRATSTPSTRIATAGRRRGPAFRPGCSSRATTTSSTADRRRPRRHRCGSGGHGPTTSSAAILPGVARISRGSTTSRAASSSG